MFRIEILLLSVVVVFVVAIAVIAQYLVHHLAPEPHPAAQILAERRPAGAGSGSARWSAVGRGRGFELYCTKIVDREAAAAVLGG
jgi:hypothetical protein